MKEETLQEISNKLRQNFKEFQILKKQAEKIGLKVSVLDFSEPILVIKYEVEF